jgi:hypothetical protein
MKRARPDSPQSGLALFYEDNQDEDEIKNPFILQDLQMLLTKYLTTLHPSVYLGARLVSKFWYQCINEERPLEFFVKALDYFDFFGIIPTDFDDKSDIVWPNIPRIISEYKPKVSIIFN